MLYLLFAIVAALSFALTVWRWILAERFPLHGPPAMPITLPGVTFLKPLKGANAETQRCLHSWFCQHYPGPVQFLFGVADENDPAWAMVRELQAEFPEADAQLVLCNEPLGANAKVSKLRQMEPFIRHPFVMISDADVEAPAPFAAGVVKLLTESNAGLVNCFYCLANPSTLAMQWEAVAVNADFWTSVLQARSLGPVKFALGAVMSLPAATLRQIGGFAALADFLADDYELGRHIAEMGGKVVFYPGVVNCREVPSGWTEVWVHQLRWARTIRACRPWAYFVSLLGNATIWPLLWVLMARDAVSIRFFGIAVAFRIFSAARQQKILTRSNSASIYGWLAPAKDILDVLLWLGAFSGNLIDWRGVRYRIIRGGKLEKVQA